MKIKLLFGVLNVATLFSATFMMAQNFQTMPVQSGYTADVIANGVGSSSLSTSSDVDGVSFAFVARDYQLTSSSTPLTYGIPANGVINTVVASTPGLSFQLGNLSGNNSLKLVAASDSGVLTFASPKAAFRLYMLSTSGSGTSTVQVQVNFTDNTSQIFSGVALSDWYGGTNYAIQGIGRINRANDVLEPNSTNPRLYQTLLTLDAANQIKPIQSVTVTKTAGTGVSNIFAFSADAYSDCVAPTLQPVVTVTSSSAQVSWTPNSASAVSYDIYYSTTNTAPAAGGAPTISGVTGTTSLINNLNPNTTYYYWVRSNCSSATGQSAWSFSGNFKTACGAVTSLFENFDSYTTGSIVPDCWIRLAGTGSQTITSTTPASGTRNIYQFNSASNTPTYVVLPVFSTINSGNYQLRLKARVSSGAPGTLTVGYVTNTADAGTFVPLQALAISNTSYTAAGSEYTVSVPATVPAGARIAIRVANDSKSYYWDDVYWETAQLSTSEVDANKRKLSIYPNPFKDVLYVSEIEKVTAVTISDVTGRIVRTIDNPTKEIDLRFLNSGLYLVTLKFRDGSQFTTKAIKN